MKHFDVVVIGLGVMGGAATYHCSRRGAKVLALDANHKGHMLGSSHGSTRAIREAYFESPEYVPLIRRSYELWRELEKECQTSLLTESGAIYIGPSGNMLTKGIEAAAEVHELEVKRLDRQLLLQQYPQFSLPEDWHAVSEVSGGILQTDACQSAHLELARKHGAEIRFETPVTSFKRSGSIVQVETTTEKYSCDKLILTMGPWFCEFGASMQLPLKGRRVVMVHLEPDDPQLFDPNNLSVFFWMTPEGVYAGFPYFKSDGIRICRHDTGHDCTPSNIQRQVTQEDIDQITNFADKYMPGAHGAVKDANVCLYTMTPDNHFIVDYHPTIPGVAFAGGFSGHGFKFAPVIGEILADLTLDSHTDHPIDFLSLNRFN